MKVIIAIALLVFIIGGFIFLQIKNRNNKKSKTTATGGSKGRPSVLGGTNV